jgi:hypothetical protein
VLGLELSRVHPEQTARAFVEVGEDAVSVEE